MFLKIKNIKLLAEKLIADLDVNNNYYMIMINRACIGIQKIHAFI